MDKTSYIYILGNDRPTLYIGVTANLERRLLWHQLSTSPNAFVLKYGLSKLLYFEAHGDILSAIEREKQLKGWHRPWKLNLIRRTNPELKDLWQIADPETSSG